MKKIQRASRVMGRQRGTAALALADRYVRLRKLRSERLLVACMPKSASTMFSRLLAGATGREMRRYVDAKKGSAQELSMSKLIDVAGSRSVAQHHVLATSDNVDLAERFDVKIVVQTRDIADALVSLRDHLNTDGIRVPTVWIPPSWSQLEPEQQIDFLIAAAAPWHLAFVRSWELASEKSGLLIHWVDYQEVTDDPATAADRTLNALGIAPVGDVRIATETVLGQRDQYRFNVGRPGRGMSLLTAEQRLRLETLAAGYQIDPARLRSSR